MVSKAELRNRFSCEELDELSMGELVILCREKGYEVTIKGNPSEFLERKALLGKLRSKPKTEKK